MEYRKVGRTGLKVSSIGLGTMFFGTQVNEADAIEIMDLAYEKGLNLFDTAMAMPEEDQKKLSGKPLKTNDMQ